MFKTAESVVKTNEDIIDEHCIRNDDGVPAVIDENMKLDWKRYVKLLNTLFEWDESSLSHSDAVGNIAHLIDKDIPRKIISKVNNRKVIKLLVVVSEMVKVAGETKVDMDCGLTVNLQMLLIYTFCCPNFFLGVPKD